MENKKVIYISGPITGVPEYYKAFEAMEDDLSAMGYIPLSPSRLPTGMSNEQYMRICLAMIDSADAVIFLPGWENSKGARLERDYCFYTDKPAFADLGFLAEVLE
jgi:nucleoside 2-deoxyribosyltransferase